MGGIKMSDKPKPGDLYQRTDGSVWRIKWVCTVPSIALTRIDDEEVTISGGVGCLNLAPFVRLIPEGSEDGQE